MDTKVTELQVNGITYVPKSENTHPAETFDGMKYVIIRTRSAGVFAGYLEKRDGMEATLKKARRIWYWSGAATLSQLAMEGTNNPSECKFPVEMDSVDLTEVIEIIDVTEKARQSIKAVPVWKV